MRGWRIRPVKGKAECKSEVTSVRRFLVTSGKPEESSRLEWPEFASGSQAVVASKEIEDLGKLEDVKILLSGSPFGFFVLAKDLSRKRL